MSLNVDKIKLSIEESVNSISGKKNHSSDVAFHMTDWLFDLERYYNFCACPEKYSAQEINKILIDFLVHVPNHVAAAGALLIGVPVSDVFGVGAVESATNDAKENSQ